MSSITELEAHLAVYKRWNDTWPGLQPTVTFCFENEKFTEPNPATSPWARVTLRPTDSNQHTLGVPTAREWLRNADVWVQLYAPLDAGIGPVARLVDSVRKVYEGFSYDGVDSAGGSRVVTLGSNGRWYEVVVISPVTYYESR